MGQWKALILYPQERQTGGELQENENPAAIKIGEKKGAKPDWSDVDIKAQIVGKKVEELRGLILTWFTPWSSSVFRTGTWWCQDVQWLNLTSPKKRGKPNPLFAAKKWRESQKTWAKHRWTLCCSLRASITTKTVFSAKNSISKPTESSGWLQRAKKLKGSNAVS